MNRKFWAELTKRFLPCLCAAIAILICIFALPTEADAATSANGTCGKNLTWTLDDAGTLTISGTGAMSNYYTHSPWYGNRDLIKAVVIPNGVTTIGSYAFDNCTSLTSITIPDSVTSIGSVAFRDCTSLTSITIPDSVTAIEASAFWNCTSLTSITIPNSVTSIGSYAFEDCTSLTSVTIGDSVTTIGQEAFSGCTSLTSVSIGDSVTTIGQEAFYGCTSLTSVTIPNGVTTIDSSAFSGCSSLESVTIGDSVTTIGSYAFSGCTSLKDVYITDPSAWCKISFCIDDLLYYADNLHILDAAGNEATQVTLDNTVTIIPTKAFYGCTSLTSVTIGEGVTSIGSYAFYNCTSLTSITIPDSVTTIGDYAFYRCTGLESVIIGDRVTSIGEDAFQICTSLQSITIGDSVSSVGDGAFSWCENLTDVYITDPSAWCKIRFADWEDSFMNYFNKLHILDAEGNEVTQVTLDNTVTRIPTKAFLHCTSLTSITIPDSVTSVGDWAFSGCTSLTDVYITDLVKWLNISFGEIDANPLSGYNKPSKLYLNDTMITDLNIPNGITSIRSYAFEGCDSLTSVTIPNSVTSIGSYAFEDCASLTSITIPDSVTTIGNSAFWACNSLKSITIPGSVTWIGSGAFEYCNSLGSITIPDGVTTIRDYTFNGCTDLESITIPESVTTIGKYAFWACNSIIDVYYGGTSQKWMSIGGRPSAKYVHYSAPSANEHWEEMTVAPTCTEQGYCTHICSCGYNYKDTYVAALGHDEITHKAKAPACTEIGWNAYVTCSRCNYSTYKEIAATGHSYTATVVKPTFVDRGYTQYTCHCGDSYKADYKDALKISAPTVSIKANTSGKQVLSWNGVGDDVIYEIHRATKKTGTYTKVATVAETNWTDTTSSGGTTYYYKVKAVYEPKPTIVSDFSGIVSQAGKCTAPTVSVKNDAKGKPYITWAKVSGAKKYTVYRATSENGKYSKLGTTTKTYYTDSKASAGNTYFYKVVANASKSTYNSGYSNIVSCGVICGMPTVTVKINTTTGKPTISWSKVSGAAKYAVYRDGELLATVTAVTYADTTAAIDTQYTYAVQALGKTEDLNGAVSKAVTATSGIAKPDVKGSINATSGKPVLSWEAVEGAVKYEIYRSTKSNKSYKLIATVETTSYEDAAVSAGKTYYYQVKAVGEVSKSALSTYDKLTGKCATPTIAVKTNAKAQPVISWSKVSGAKKYTIYRSTSETSGYKSIGTSKTTSYTDTKATPGRVYYYKVIANASSSKYNSGYSNIVNCGVCCATPAVKVSNNSAGKVTLSWSKISGAVKYEVYLLGAEDYVTLGVVTGTSWTDTEAGIGEGRYYGVRAIAAKEDYNSEVSEPVFGRTTCATPKITGKVGANKKPIISWGAVEGATKYIIYRSTSSSKGFAVIGETEDLSWEDLTAVKGKTYYYKVVAVGEGYQSAMSSYVKVKSK